MKKKQFVTAAIVTAMVLPTVFSTSYAEGLPKKDENKKVEAVSNEVPSYKEVVFADSAEKILSFSDVPTTHYAYKHIMGMAEQGVIKGYPDGTFKPNLSISREHVALMFYRAFDLGNQEPVRAGKNFTDVPKNYVYYDEIQAVYRAGLFDGKDGNSFDPKAPMTRAEMAKVIVTAFDLERHQGYIFKDVSEKHWAKDYIATVYAHGIAKGSNGDYMPNAPIKRADFSILLYNSLNPDEVEKPTEPLKPTPPVVEKPVEPKPTEPKPINPTPTKVNYIYADTNPKDLPRPKGYVVREHERKNQEEMSAWMKKHGTNSHGSIPMNRKYVEESIKTEFVKKLGVKANNYEEFVQYIANQQGLTVNELVAIATQAVQTGKVVYYENQKGIKYAIYCNYPAGNFMIVNTKLD